jgi:hypothetical protein
MSSPAWVWLYFGAFGTVGAVLYTLVAWCWMKLHSRASGSLRSTAKWSMVALMFLFIAAYFACGIGSPPGSLLSPEQSTHDLEAAYDSALLAIFFSVPGWACALVSMTKLLQSIKLHEEMSLE